MKYYNQLTLEELLAKTLLELDSLHEELDRNEAGLQATSLNTLLRALIDLRRDGPLSQTAAEAIRLVDDILGAAIAEETLGHRNAFDGINDPDPGGDRAGDGRADPVKPRRVPQRDQNPLPEDPRDARAARCPHRCRGPDCTLQGRLRPPGTVMP